MHCTSLRGYSDLILFVSLSHYGQLENYVSPVPTYCAAVRLTFNRLSYRKKSAHRLPWETLTPILVFYEFQFFEL